MGVSDVGDEAVREGVMEELMNDEAMLESIFRHDESDIDGAPAEINIEYDHSPDDIYSIEEEDGDFYDAVGDIYLMVESNTKVLLENEYDGLSEIEGSHDNSMSEEDEDDCHDSGLQKKISKSFDPSKYGKPFEK